MRQLQIQKMEQKYENFAYSSMNFDFLSTECDKCDFGLIEYEHQKLRSTALYKHVIYSTCLSRLSKKVSEPSETFK